MSLNTIFDTIYLKEKNSGGYLKIPQDGGIICLVRSIKNATIFTNSNYAHWMISEIKARSYMACYHDWNLIEVDSKGKPMNIQERIQKKKEEAANVIAASSNLSSINNNESQDKKMKNNEET